MIFKSIFVVVLIFISPVSAGELPPGHDCKLEWIKACVGSNQDKYRNWHPPKIHTFEEQDIIMKNSRHICEFTNEGPCANIKLIESDNLRLNRLEDGTINVE